MDNEALTQVNGLEVLISEDIKSITDHTVVDFISSPNGEMFDIDSGLAGC